MSTELPDSRRAEYLKLLDLHNANRIDYNTRKWETVKFFEGIFTVLLGATIAAIIAVNKEHLWGDPLLALSIAALLLVSALSVLIGRDNLKRESRLLYLEEAQMFKIAHFLQLDRPLQADEAWLPGDNNLLMLKCRSSSYGASDLPELPSPQTGGPCGFPVRRDLGQTARLEDWVHARMSEHKFLDLFGVLFISEAFIAILLMLGIIRRFATATG
jgi:hypothetical protein